MAYRTDQERQIDRLQPPQSLEAEQAVLGCVLKDVGALHEVVEILTEEAVFYSPKHQMVYRAILELYEKTEPCDITTVSNALLKDDKLTRLGGRVFLVELVESVAATANAKHYADIVLDKYLLRRTIEITNEISRSCYNLDQPVSDLLDQAEAGIFGLSEKRLRRGFVPISKLIPSTFDQIEELQSPDSSLVGLKTGFTEFDVLTNGLHKGELIIIAGRPSMGKSALVMNMAENMAVNQNKSVGVFSVEMSAEALSLRMLCGRARVSQQKLRAGKLRDEEWGRLSRAGGPLSESNIFIDDSPGLTALEMKAKARRLKGQHGIDLIIIDYIQMVQGSGRYENRQQEIAALSRGLKTLAMELEIPVIACSQLSRQVEQRGGDKRPVLSDLRESGAIEQDADVVAFVYRQEHYFAGKDRSTPEFQEVEGKAELIVSKQRNGPTGVVHLAFVKDYACFENLAYRPAELPADVEPVSGDEDIPF
ncbi:MAG: replicative DNA helicase [candidate division Zixibacteria bacterium]|nr:replicative DNA helicase [candidate division Zixibacteria bacterium]MDH3936873.1 replicative DNA helicase [candidate division Zixibacteria bacterium]